MAKNNLKNKIVKGLTGIIAGAALLTSAGCATTSSFAGPGYERYYDSYGDYKLIGKNNDIYMERLDGSESRRITYTPNIKEYSSYLINDGNYIIYAEPDNWPNTGKRFIIPGDSDDKQRKEISPEEYGDLHYQDLVRRRR